MASEDPRAIALSDACEADAWRDLFAAMPAPMKAATGVRVVDTGGAMLLVAPGTLANIVWCGFRRVGSRANWTRPS